MTALDLSAIKELPPPKLEALVEMMYLAAAADGEFSDIEQEHFKKSVQSLTDDRIKGHELEQLIDKAKKDLADNGMDKCIESVKERLPETGARKVALALAIQVAAADGIIRTSERELILETAEVLGIAGDEAADMVSDLTR